MGLFRKDSPPISAPAAPAAEFGPFEPPADFAFPEALAGEPPRSRPLSFMRSFHQRRWQQAAINCGVAAAACVSLSQMSFVQTVGFYILPLAYLDWIGYGLGVIALFILIRGLASVGPFAFIRDGTPTIGRVLGVQRETVKVGEAVQFRFAVDAEYPDPITHQPSRRTFHSRKFGSLLNEKKWSLDLAPGQYTTIVVRPGAKDNAQIYGLLDADADQALLLKSGKPDAPPGIIRTLAGAAAFVAILCLALAGIYAFEFLCPENGRALPLVIGLGGGAAVGVSVMLALARSKKEDGKRTRRLIGSVIGGVVLGVLGGAVVLIVLNAKLDRSAPTFEDVEIVEVWENTHHAIFRSYEFEYRSLQTGEKLKYPATMDSINDMQVTRTGWKEKREGAFGMPWVAGLRPCLPIPANPDTPRPKHTITVGVKPDGAPDAKESQVEFGLLIAMPDGSFREPSDRLAALAEANLRAASP